METLIDKMKRTGFNPIAVSDQDEQVVSRKEENGFTYILEIVGTASLSSLADLNLEPAVGKEIKTRYNNYETITAEDDDYIIFRSNAIIYSVFEVNDKGNAHALVKQLVNEEIAKENIF